MSDEIKRGPGRPPKQPIVMPISDRYELPKDETDGPKGPLPQSSTSTTEVSIADIAGLVSSVKAAVAYAPGSRVKVEVVFVVPVNGTSRMQGEYDRDKGTIVGKVKGKAFECSIHQVRGVLPL